MKALIGKIFSPHNRGILLDVLIFLLNILLVHQAVCVFYDFKNDYKNNDWHAFALNSFLTGILFLAPLGATLNRYGFWARLQAQGRAEDVQENIDYYSISMPAFCVLWMYLLSLMVGIMWYEKFLFHYLSFSQMFLICFLVPPLYAAGGTFLVRKFFIQPEKEPIFKFLASPISFALGEILLFLNMICFQILWATFTDEPFRVNGNLDYFFNIIGFILLFLIFYLPPRSFYLATDIERPAVRWTILLANLPTFLFLIFGFRIF